jgi:hypothetical protein
MRKRIIQQDPRGVSPDADRNWLELDRLAQVELTSEHPDFQIESALTMNGGPGWRAGEAGQQTIRLLFDEPLGISSIQLLFQEDERERTQEFALSWSPHSGAPGREIARQQYNFSPPHATRELEDYSVDLRGVAMLELVITPDISGGDARASLARLRLA